MDPPRDMRPLVDREMPRPIARSALIVLSILE
jgi:hypothetical protein